LRVLPLSGVVLFTLAWLGGITAGFTRWRFVAVALLVLAYVGAALVSGESAPDAAMAGAVDGALAALLVYALLRYDWRAVPAFLAAAAVLQAVAGAAQKSGSTAWLHAALTAAGAVAAAWLVTRYLERTGAGGAPAPGEAQRTVTQ
jgi:multisubunit Na+/H+ antiporter MnhB subunit